MAGCDKISAEIGLTIDFKPIIILCEIAHFINVLSKSHKLQWFAVNFSKLRHPPEM